MMRSEMDPIFQTRRLEAHELTAADLDFIATQLGDPRVMQFWPRPYARAEAEQWIKAQQERYARHGHGYWLLRERESGAPVGQVGLLMTTVDDAEEPALGYILHWPYWKRGYAVEAGAATLDWAFHLRGYPRVTCLVRPENVPSMRVAARVGLVPERYVEYQGFQHLLWARCRTDGAAR